MIFADGDPTEIDYRPRHARGWRRTARVIAADLVAVPLIGAGLLGAAVVGGPLILAGALAWRSIGGQP